MSAFQRYIRFHLKSILVREVVMALLMAMIAFTWGAAKIGRSQFGRSANIENDIYYGIITVVAFVAVIYAFIIPVLEFAPYKNRRNIDLWFSSPLSRNDIFRVGYISGLIQLAASLLISMMTVSAKMIVFNTQGADFNLAMPSVYFGVLLLSTAVVYTINCFLFICANSVVDGVIYLIFFSLIPGNIAKFIMLFREKTTNIRELVNNINEMLTRKYYAHYELPVVFTAKLDIANIDADKRYNEVLNYLDSWLGETYVIVIWSVIWVLAAAASLYFASRVFSRMKSEKLGGPSDLLFGYTILIPAWGYSKILSQSTSILVSPMFTLVVMFIGYVIYRKGVKLKGIDWLMLGIGAVILIVSQVISFATETNTLSQFLR
ncbi:MAG: ABC transporter permease [Clostridiales bacterium]|nr:ABC transporter permease [Clostridiales bacterium]